MWSTLRAALCPAALLRHTEEERQGKEDQGRSVRTRRCCDATGRLFLGKGQVPVGQAVLGLHQQREMHWNCLCALCPESPRPGGKRSSRGRTEQPPTRALEQWQQSTCRTLSSLSLHCPGLSPAPLTAPHRPSLALSHSPCPAWHTWLLAGPALLSQGLQPALPALTSPACPLQPHAGPDPTGRSCSSPRGEGRQ